MANERSSPTRRKFLEAAGGVAVAGITGCTGRADTGGDGNSPSGTAGTTRRESGRSEPVSVLAAGSLQHALESGLEPTLDVPISVEAHGSATIARMVAEGQRDPDIVTVADTALFDRPLSPSWYSVFASNAIVLAYNPNTEGGRRIAERDDERWYEPLVSGDVRLGRTDPNQDPLGYRTLFTLDLATRHYDDAPDLGEEIPRRDQIYPETALISQFETGSIDAAIAYRNMAVERGYEYVGLPDRIDLSNPEYVEEWYSTVSYVLANGQEIRGDVISYGSTIRKTSDAALAVFDAHTTGDYLTESGFVRDSRFPRYEGTLPDGVRDVVDPDETNDSGGTPPSNAARSDTATLT